MDSINVGLIGAGTVGCGVYKLLKDNISIIRERTGLDIKIKKIADIEPDRKRPVRIPKRLFTTDSYELINDRSIQIIVELIGGTTVAKKLVLDSLDAGKHVVTANKALIALHGDEIFSTAEKNDVAFGFEASVGGGIPIIRATKQGYTANNILSIHGILNGTSNYILDRMGKEGKEFSDVLSQAQDEGYAESDPSFDIDGVDAAHKLSILIMLSWGKFFDFDNFSVEGIRKISQLDIAFADELGYKIKLLAIAKVRNSMLEAAVYPALVRKGTQLADVSDAFNAVYVVGDAVGPTMLYGMGAGMMPTASAVVSDIIEISKNLENSSTKSLPRLYSKEKDLSLVDLKDTMKSYYLRFQVEDRPGILGHITGILGDKKISIKSMIQKGRNINGGEVAVVIMTHDAKEKNLLEALREIERNKKIKDKTMFIRIEEV